MSLRLSQVGAATALSFQLAACSPHSVVSRPATPVDVPEAYHGSQAKASRAADGRLPWWQSMDDPALAQLQRLALRSNLQIRVAWERLRQAEALAVIGGAARWPQVSVDLGASRTRNAFFFMGSDFAIENNRFTGSIPVNYELDLFAKNASTAKAAELEAFAAREDLEAAVMSLSAELAETWYDLVQARAQRDILDAQVRESTTFFELLEMRFAQGLSSAADYHQQGQQLRALRAQRVALDARIELLENSICSLLGAIPGSIELPSDTALPVLRDLPNAGLPSDLLEQRPDVRAARTRIVAADHRVAAAVSDRLPSILLRGNIGFSATSLASFFDNVIWSLAGALSQPLVDGGRRGAEQRRQEAMVRERLLLYGQAVLQALVEVENSLLIEKNQSAQITELDARLGHAKAALELSRERFVSGLTDFIPVLSAIVSQQQAELDRLAADRQRISARIQLHRALGGTWTERLTPPAAPELKEEEE